MVWKKSTNRRIWFEVLEGKDYGIRISIPLRDKSYSEDVRERLSELKEGHVVEATILRNGPADSWKPTKPPEIVSEL